MSMNNPSQTEMDFEEWIVYGVSKRWVTMPVCDIHNGYPLTDEEIAQFDEGWDPCIPVMRVWWEETQGDDH